MSECEASVEAGASLGIIVYPVNRDEHPQQSAQVSGKDEGPGKIGITFCTGRKDTNADGTQAVSYA
jgi:hypothetical protein